MTALKVFGGYFFGPFCPFRGHRVKSPGHKLLGFLACCGLMAFVAIEGYAISVGVVKEQFDSRDFPQAHWVPWTLVVLGPLTVFMLYGTLFTRALLKLAAILCFSLFIYHFRIIPLSVPRLADITQDWLRTTGMVWLAALTTGFFAADLLTTALTVFAAILWPRTPWFASYSRLSGWRRNPRSQKQGPLGIAVVDRDRILAGRVVWLWMETGKELLRIERYAGEVMEPLTAENSLQLSDLERPLHLWHRREWRCDLRTSEALTCRWLVPIRFSSAPDATKFRQQPATNFQADALLPENANWYCLSESVATTRDILGLFVLADEREPIPFGEALPWKPILRTAAPAQLTLEHLTLDCTPGSGQLTVSIGTPSSRRHGPGYSLPLDHVSVVLIPYRKHLQYLFFIPL